MKRILMGLALILFVTACAAPASPTSTASPTTEPAQSATAPGSTPVAATPQVQTSSPSATDLSSQNSITLAAPACDGTFTPAQTEGPYYKEGSPEAKVLYQTGMTGTRLIVAGYVLDANCQPVPGAWLDFWQADGEGNYDNQGYTLRGHQTTDEQGRYFLETVVPGEYPGRTQHIHVKVQAPGGEILTSQLYFPGSAGNTTDRIYTPATQVTIEDRGDYQVAYYNFVLDTP